MQEADSTDKQPSPKRGRPSKTDEEVNETKKKKYAKYNEKRKEDSLRLAVSRVVYDRLTTTKNALGLTFNTTLLFLIDFYVDSLVNTPAGATEEDDPATPPFEVEEESTRMKINRLLECSDESFRRMYDAELCESIRIPILARSKSQNALDAKGTYTTLLRNAFYK